MEKLSRQKEKMPSGRKWLMIICSVSAAVWLSFFTYENICVYKDIGATFFTPPKTKIIKESSSRHSDEDIQQCIELLCASSLGKNRFNNVYLLEVEYDDSVSLLNEQNCSFEKIELVGDLYYGTRSYIGGSYGEGVKEDGVRFSFKKDTEGSWVLYSWGEG